MCPMTKEDLIYKWRETDGHPARQILPAIFVAIVFIFFFSVLDVRFDTPGNAALKNVSVIFFPDDEMGRAWRLKAEEEGPFPGRLEISGSMAFSDSGGVGSLRGVEIWNDYSIEMRPIQSSRPIPADRIAPKGVRYFPSRESREESNSEKLAEVISTPVLITYDKKALEWLPEKLPPFPIKLEEGTASASWRFLLNLRANGTVAQCFSLSGGREASLLAMVEWLKTQRFKESEEEVRWVGLRVEFINKSSDGTDPE